MSTQEPRIEMQKSIAPQSPRELTIEQVKQAADGGDHRAVNVVIEVLGDLLTEARCDYFIDQLIRRLPGKLAWFAWPLRRFLDWATPGPLLAALRAALQRPSGK